MLPRNEVDSTIDEIHRTRERIHDKFGGNIRAIVEDARQRQAKSGRPVWSRVTVAHGIETKADETE